MQARLAALSLGQESDDGTEDEWEVAGASAPRPPTHRGKQSNISGAQRTAQPNAIIEQNWPHYHVDRGVGNKEPVFDDLTLPEFLYGYFFILNNYEVAGQIHSAILLHMQMLMSQACRFPWPFVRHFHKLVLRKMELGHILWGDVEAIKEVRDNMPPPGASTARATPQRPRDLPRPVPKGPEQYCGPFQLNNCQLPGDHDSPSGWVRHICAYCQRQPNSPSYNHGEFNCNRKAKDQQITLPKNLD